jgi:hypothetical protein
MIMIRMSNIPGTDNYAIDIRGHENLTNIGARNRKHSRKYGFIISHSITFFGDCRVSYLHLNYLKVY